MKKNSPETLISSQESESSADLNAKYFADGYPDSERFLEILEENSPELVETYQTVLKICDRLRNEGGQALLVGGSVRDYFFGIVPKDYDLEVYRLEPAEIKKAVAEFGTISEVGEAFGILLLTLANGDTVDISLPRRESKTGVGHKGFAVAADPYMSVKEAARRRDFSINSLAANPLTGELYNYFGGLADAKDKILKVTDEERFKDDPLRVLRGAQFVARLGLSVDSKSSEIMQEIVPNLGELSKERFLIEWNKLLIKGFRPSQGLEFLKRLGVLKTWHPELEVLAELPQEEEWHPEGDVWQHTMMAVDAASEHLDDFKLTDNQKLNVMLATLCHDLGKATTTEYSEEKQRIISHGHEEAGEQPTKKFLASIGLDPNNIEFRKIIKLVTEHLSPTLLYASRFEGSNRVKTAADGAIRRLSKRIQPATIRELTAVATADHLGRGPFTESDGQILINLYTAGDWLVKEAERLGVDKEPPKKLLSGKDLLILGFKPGKNVGRAMNLADNLRDSQGLSEADVLGQMVIAKPEGIKNAQDEEEVISALEQLFSE